MRTARTLIYLFLFFIILQIFTSNDVHSADAPVYNFRIYFLSKKEEFPLASLKSLASDIKSITFHDEGYIDIQSSSYDDTASALMGAIDQIENAKSLTFINNDKEVELRKIPDPDLFHTVGVKQNKALPTKLKRIPFTLFVKEEYVLPEEILKLRKQITQLGYRVNRALPAHSEFHSFFYIQINVGNTVDEVTRAIERLTDLPQISSVSYNTSTQHDPTINRYRVVIGSTKEREEFIHKVLANDIEVYRIQAASNSVWIHFPRPDNRNEYFLKQIAKMKGVLEVSDVYANRDQKIKAIDSSQYKIMALRLPVPYVEPKLLSRDLYVIAKNAAQELNSKGFIVTDISVGTEGDYTYYPLVIFAYPVAEESHFQRMIDQYTAYEGSVLFRVDEKHQLRDISLKSCAEFFD